MKKTLYVTIALLMLTVFFTLALSGCDMLSSGNDGKTEGPSYCEHEYENATCQAPKTCKKCGSTIGIALSHDWEGGTCIASAACTMCGIENGKFAKHEYVYSTCTTPTYCTVCNYILAEAEGHYMTEADCYKPATCTVCDYTEGEPQHVVRPATCLYSSYCYNCPATFGEPLGHDMTAATCEKASKCTRCSKTEGKALGHDYEKNLCHTCGKKGMEKPEDIWSFLYINYGDITTVLGTITVKGFEVVINDPNYWEDEDFEVRIESDLYIKDIKSSLDYTMVYGDFLPYETRIQAIVDVLNYQKEIIDHIETAFPDKKFSVKFFLSGYAYPNIYEGYWQTTLLDWQNWERIPGGSTGYAGTVLTDWTIYTRDFLYYPYNNNVLQMVEDIDKAYAYANLEFLAVYS